MWQCTLNLFLGWALVWVRLPHRCTGKSATPACMHMEGQPLRTFKHSVHMHLHSCVCLYVCVCVCACVCAGNAYRPLDVLRTRSGITVENGNTDAEGRLILCDAVNLLL